MENDSKLGSAADEGVTNDLMVVNELIYKIPPDLNITQTRTQKKYVADQQTTSWQKGQSLRFTMQTGLEYVDMQNSSIDFDLEAKIDTTFKTPPADDVKTRPIPTAAGLPLNGPLWPRMDLAALVGVTGAKKVAMLPTRASTNGGS